MKLIPEELRHVLVSTPDTLGGAVRFAGTRVPLQALLDSLQAGHSIESFLEGWPDVSRKSAQCVIDWEMNRMRESFGLEETGS